MTDNSAVQMRSLGHSGLLVSPIGLGVMEFSGKGVFKVAFPEISQTDKNAIVKAALNGGINWFDTAEMYGLGVSERSLATALDAAGKTDQDVVVATKWLPLFRTASNIRRSIGNRLQALEGYSIDLYMVHQPWSFSSPEAEMDAMGDLVEAGKIRAVGVSNFSADRMRRAHKALQARGLPLAVNQVKYSLMDRQIETNGILETAKELGVTIIAYTPLESGLLSGKYHKNPALLDQGKHLRKGQMRRNLEKSRPLIAAMEEIGARYHATPAQIALNWLIHFQGEWVVTIPGATKVYQAEESAHAQAFHLSDDELVRLDELSRAWR